MNLPIRQRAGYEPTHHFDSQALKQTGIDSPTFAELNRTYQYDKAMEYFEIVYQRAQKRGFQEFDKKYWKFYSENKK